MEMYGQSSKVFASVYLSLALGLLLFAVTASQIYVNVSNPSDVCMRTIPSNSTAAVSLGYNAVPFVSPDPMSIQYHLVCRPSEVNDWWTRRCDDSDCRSSALLPSTFKPRSSISRSSFDSFGPAIFTVYCMVQLEGWSDLMYDSMHSVSAAMAVYWVTLVIVLAFCLNRFERVHSEFD